MACSICKLPSLHGSQLGGRPGSYLAESGCHNGVWMDDDEYAEGWQPDVVTRPCPNNPDRCSACNGSGVAAKEVTTQDDCPACDGTGWRNGDWKEPDDRYRIAAPTEGVGESSNLETPQ